MEALLAHLEPVNVEEREPDLRAALDVALDRLELAVQRHVERSRSQPRRKLVRARRLEWP